MPAMSVQAYMMIQVYTPTARIPASLLRHSVCQRVLDKSCRPAPCDTFQCSGTLPGTCILCRCIAICQRGQHATKAEPWCAREVLLSWLPYSSSGYKIDTTLGRHEAEHIWAPWPCHSGHPQLIADAGVTAVKAEAGFFNEL